MRHIRIHMKFYAKSITVTHAEISQNISKQHKIKIDHRIVGIILFRIASFVCHKSKSKAIAISRQFYFNLDKFGSILSARNPEKPVY